MSWQTSIQTADAITSKYLKLKSGESAEVIFLGEPEHSIQCYDTEENKGVKYDPMQHDGDPRYNVTTKWLINVATLPKLTPQVFQCGVSLFRELAIEFQKGRITRSTYEISREGEGKSTKWKLRRENDITAEQKEALKIVELHPLDSDDFPF